MDFNELWNLDISEIWNLNDQNSFVIAMDSWVCRKSDYGKNMDALTAEEKVFYICVRLEGEVNNGGFSQYLYNSSGNNAQHLVESMKAIGANKTAEICHTALSAFQQPIPQDWDERQTFLDESFSDEIDDILCQCDSLFFNYEDDLEHLNYLYIQAHKDSFC